jgi:hypothetical protein
MRRAVEPKVSKIGIDLISSRSFSGDTEPIGWRDHILSPSRHPQTREPQAIAFGDPAALRQQANNKESSKTQNAEGLRRTLRWIPELLRRLSRSRMTENEPECDAWR